jgi:hypothetical protein
LIDYLCDGHGGTVKRTNACHNLQLPEYHVDFRVKRWVVMNVKGRAIDRGELSLWMHPMKKPSEMRKNMVARRWSMMRCGVVGSI